MSKELNALECLEALEQDIKDRTILAEDRQLKLCAVIKQALLELQSIKEANPSEALECLDKLAKQIELDEDTDYFEIRNAHITVEQALLNAEKEHKALEIIKEKEVNMQVFNQCEDVETYNKVYIKQKDRQLTQEEFNLLREVLE